MNANGTKLIVILMERSPDRTSRTLQILVSLNKNNKHTSHAFTIYISL